MLIDWDPVRGPVTMPAAVVSDIAVVDLPNDCELDSQHFACKGSRSHVCRDGREVRLYTWRSHCEACGASFDFTVPSSRVEFSPTRRCKTCRRPGSKAAAEERRVERAAKVRALIEADPSLDRQFPNGLPDWVINPDVIR